MAAQPHLLAFKQPICTYRLVLILIMRVLSAIEQFLEDDNDVPIGRERHGVATLLLPSYDPRTLKDQRCSYASSTPAACKQGSSQGHARIMCVHVDFLENQQPINVVYYAYINIISTKAGGSPIAPSLYLSTMIG